MRHLWKFQTIFSNSTVSNNLLIYLHPIRLLGVATLHDGNIDDDGEKPRQIVSINRSCYNYFHRNVDCRFLEDCWTDHDETFRYFGGWLPGANIDDAMTLYIIGNPTFFPKFFYPQFFSPKIFFPNFCYPPKICSPTFISLNFFPPISFPQFFFP